MNPVIDPRDGDVEDDASSTKRRSLLSLAGSLLAEISLPKLILSWTMLFVVPGPPARTFAAGCLRLGRGGLAQNHIPAARHLACAGPCGCARRWIVWRAIAVSYCREQFLVFEFARGRTAIRRLPGGFAASYRDASAIATRSIPVRDARAATAGAAGIIIFAVAMGVLYVCWPGSRWLGNFADFASPRDLIFAALANSVVLVAAYLAVAALVWASPTRPCLNFVISASFPRLGRQPVHGALLTCRIFMSLANATVSGSKAAGSVRGEMCV